MIKYTAEQRKFFEEFTEGHHLIEIADEFYNRFGIRLSKGQVKGCLRRWNLKTGFTGRFEKLSTPANKGKKMSSEQYKLAEPTMFKKGNVPFNTLPIGTEKVLKDDYIWVKVNNIPHAKKNVNWRQKQRLIYENAYGPIPKGSLVTFLDGNKRNFDLDNLAVITRAEHAMMNNKRMRTNNKELTKTSIAIAQLELLCSERSK